MRDAEADLGLAEGAGAANDDLHTPILISPPESKTPPTARNKRNITAPGAIGNGKSAETLDATALSRALEKFEQAGRHRDLTPGLSPSRKRQRVYGDRLVDASEADALALHHLKTTLLRWASEFNADSESSRFIPNRSGQDFPASFSLLHEDGSPATPSKSAKRTPHNELHFQKSMCASNLNDFRGWR